MFGHGLNGRFRSGEDPDPPGLSCLTVDRINARPDTGNDPQPGTGIDHHLAEGLGSCNNPAGAIEGLAEISLGHTPARPVDIAYPALFAELRHRWSIMVKRADREGDRAFSHLYPFSCNNGGDGIKFLL